MQTPLNEKSPSNQDPQDANSKRFLLYKTLIKISLKSFLALLVFIFVIALSTLVLLIKSQDSREWFVLNAIPGFLSSKDLQLEIQGLNSNNIGHWYFESITLSNNGELVFQSESLLLNLAASSILEKKIDIIEVSAASLRFSLTQYTQPNHTEKNNHSEFNISTPIIPIRLQKLNLNNVEIIDTKNAIPQFQVTGDATYFWENSLISSNLLVLPLENPSSHYQLTTTINKQYVGTIEANIKETPDGWLGQQLGIPNTQDLELLLNIEAYSEQELVHWTIASFSMPYQNHQISAQGHGLLEISSQKLTFPSLAIFIDKQPQRFSGWWHKETFELNAELTNFPINLTSHFQNYLVGGQVNGKVNASGLFTKPLIKMNLDTKTQYKNEDLSLELQGESGINTFNIHEAKINYGLAALKTSGSLDINNQEFNLLIHQLTGPVSIIEKFELSLPEHLDINILETSGFLSGPFKSPNYKGSTKATGHYKEQSFMLDGYFEGDIDKINLTQTHLKIDEALINVNGLIDWLSETLKLAVETRHVPIELLNLFQVKLPENLTALSHSELNITGSFSEPKFSGQSSTEGMYKNKAFLFETDFRADLAHLNFDNFNANLDGGTLQSSGTVDWANNQLDLSLASENLPISLLDLLNINIPKILEGKANINGRLTGMLTSPNFEGTASTALDFQQRHFQVTTNIKSSVDTVQLDQFYVAITQALDSKNNDQISSISGNGYYHFTSQEIEANLSLKSVAYNIIELADIQLPASLNGIINADLYISDKLPIPMIRGQIESTGKFEGEEFYFNVTGSQQEQSLFFNETRIKWNDTLLTANGSVSKDNLDLNIALSELKLDDLNKFGYSFNPGRLNLNIDLSGSLETPILKGLAELRLVNKDYLNQKNSEIVIMTQLATQDERLAVTTNVIQGEENKGYLSINSQLSPYYKWLFDASDLRTITSLPLDLDTQGDIGLNWINNFIDRDIHKMSGNLSLNTTIGGSIDQPRINGIINLEQGKYQNVLSQTSIEDARIQLIFDEKSISIMQAEASDGQKGKIYLNGSAELSDTNYGLVDVTLVLDKTSLVRREDIEGEASGSINLSGDLKNMLLKGDIDVSPFQIMLDLIPKDSIPEIEVSISEDTNNTESKKLKFPETQLNIQVNIDQQAYIRGRGLDAELKGNIDLNGTIHKPNYNGQFKVIRGNFELFAKKFKLDEGTVLFSNDAVSLYVQGKHTSKEITFIASLSGTLDNLKITLLTEPSLPEDEALARLLFGKSVRNITPVQAIQLASAIQTLRGESSKFDPLGTARELLHVDSISVESQETSQGNGLAVGLGKYITEGVYLELMRTPEPSQPWKGTVEIELSPNINLETTSGGNSGFGGVELQWKKDY